MFQLASFEVSFRELGWGVELSGISVRPRRTLFDSTLDARANISTMTAALIETG